MQLKLVDNSFYSLDNFWIKKFCNYLLIKGRKYLVFKVVKFVSIYFKRLGLYFYFDLCEIIYKIKPLIKLRLVKKKWGNKNLQVVSAPQLLDSNGQKIKAMFWLALVIKESVQSSYFCYNFIGEISDNIAFGFGKSLSKRKEYYSYAVNYKILKFYKWST